jgi:hypothetical protein
MAKFGHFLSLKNLWFGQNQHFFCDKFSSLSLTKNRGSNAYKGFFISQIGGKKKKKNPEGN